MDNLYGASIYDDPYCLEDEPKEIQVEAEARVEEEITTNIESKNKEQQESGLYEGCIQVPMNKKASITSDASDGAIREIVIRKPKKRANVWTKTSTRKGNKKGKPAKVSRRDKVEESLEVNSSQHYVLEEKNGIQLSKDQKAEKVELSFDKLQASSEKGYRMVRATRGVTEGPWYFEIIVKDLGKTGHTRLGWSTWKGDLQAPVGFDINSYAYRDVDGSKVHQAVREPFGEAYKEGDVIGFYINLPNGADYAPKYDLYVYKASRTVFSVPLEKNEGPLQHVPESEILFFKNGVCQGVAFKDVIAGEYFPAASMYTLPTPEKKCSVRFNFGPNLICPPKDWGNRAHPQPMSQAPLPKGLATDYIEPPATSNLKDTKKGDSATKAGGKQRMTAERGNGVVTEGGLLTGNGGALRTKRANDERDKGKRIRVCGKKGMFGRGRKVGLFPCPMVTKAPVSNVPQQRKLILAGRNVVVTKNILQVSPMLQDSDESSDDEQTE